MSVSLAIVLYGASWILLLRDIFAGQTQVNRWFRLLLALGILAHMLGCYLDIYTPAGLDLSVYKFGLIFLWVPNLLILVSSLRKPLHNLFAVLLPLSIAALLISLLAPEEAQHIKQLEPGLNAHIAISLIAYGIMTLATIQALLLAFQDHKIKSKHPSGIVRLLPPMQTMEKLFFELIWAGEIFLSLVILSGALFVDDMLAQHLVHKTVLTILAWCIYAILLWGRHKLGWRGSTAIRWALAGFVFLVLAYIGSKFVLELVLQR